MAKTKVRLTIRPDEEIEVPADEVPILRHQGLLIEDDPAGMPPKDDAGKPAVAAKTAKTTANEGA